MSKTVDVQWNDAGEVLVVVQRDQPDAYFLHFNLEEAERCAQMMQRCVNGLRIRRMCEEAGANPDDFISASPPRPKGKPRGRARKV
jgi:hypothetical protein